MERCVAPPLALASARLSSTMSWSDVSTGVPGRSRSRRAEPSESFAATGAIETGDPSKSSSMRRAMRVRIVRLVVLSARGRQSDASGCVGSEMAAAGEKGL